MGEHKVCMCCVAARNISIKEFEVLLIPKRRQDKSQLFKLHNFLKDKYYLQMTKFITDNKINEKWHSKQSSPDYIYVCDVKSHAMLLITLKKVKRFKPLGWTICNRSLYVHRKCWLIQPRLRTWVCVGSRYITLGMVVHIFLT